VKKIARESRRLFVPEYNVPPKSFSCLTVPGIASAL